MADTVAMKIGHMQGGQVATTAGVGIDVVRFYGRKGSLPEFTRQPSGHRDPAPEAVLDLQSMKRTEAPGPSLRAISERLLINREPDAKAADVEKLAEERPADPEERLCSLQEMEKILRKVMERWPGRGPTSECSILQCPAREA